MNPCLTCNNNFVSTSNHQKYCRECGIIHRKELSNNLHRIWRENNPEKVLESGRRYRIRNKKIIKERMRIYNQKPEVQEKQLLRNRIYRSRPEVKELYKIKNNTVYLDSRIKASKNYFNKMSSMLDITIKDYRVGLISWSKKIKQRDDFKCVICGVSNQLESHHIFPKMEYPKLAFNINNGVTLCREHHNEITFDIINIPMGYKKQVF